MSDLISNKLKDTTFNYIIFLFILFIVGAWVVFSSIETLNRDGVMYLIQAHHINSGNLDGAYTIFPKITFAYLIAFVQRISGLGYLESAHILSYLFFIGYSLIFFKSLEISLKEKSNFKYLVGLTIMLTGVQYLDSYLEMVLRDHGFLFFISFGFYFFLKYIFEEKKPFFILLSVILFFFASFFRNEALIYPLFITIYLIFHGLNDYLSKTNDLRSYFYLFISGIFIFLILFLLKEKIFNFDFFIQRLGSFIHNLSNPIDLKTDHFWLSKLLESHNHLIKFSLLSGVFIWKFLNFTGLFYFLLSLIYFKFFYQKNHLPILVFLFISLLPVFLNFSSTYVLSGRYFLSSLIFLNLLLAYCIAEIINKRNIFIKYNNRFFYIFMLLLALISFLDILIDKKNINYEKNLALWFLSNNIDISTIYSNDERVDYYMNRFIHQTERPQVDIAINQLQYKYFLIRDDDFLNKYSNFKELKIESPYQHKDLKVFYRVN